MPTYEYECKRCSMRFEIKRGFHETGGNICPICGEAGQQIFQAPPLLFKGSGFYITDSRKATGQKEEGSPAAKPEAGKSESKVEAAKPAPATGKSDTSKK